MELIVKPTDRCNFACTFCSSPELGGELDMQKVYEFLERYPETKTIILNGGDPLMIKPAVYWELLEYLEERDMETIVSFTSNLWAFYKQPEKWAPVFRHRLVKVCTSFNYGNTRRVTKEMVYTEDLFMKVMDTFNKYVGYYPPFISVITEENKDKAIDNVRLAKKFDTVCKLNKGVASGRQGKPFPLSDMYEIYLELHKEGLTPWEHNTQQIFKVIDKDPTICPIARNCDETIRVLQPDGYFSCGALADDKLYEIDLAKEMGGEHFTPLQKDPHTYALKKECFGCYSFDFCNGCRKNILDAKTHDLVEYNCPRMKDIIGEFINQSDIPM